MFLQICRDIAAVRPDVDFLVLGDGPERSALDELAVQLGLSNRVRFLRYLPDPADVVKSMRALDVFALPTEREGFGMVFAEAMATETAVVGPDIPPINWIVTSGETGILVERDNRQAYVDAVLRFLDDAALQALCGARGREGADPLRLAAGIQSDRGNVPAVAGEGRGSVSMSVSIRLKVAVKRIVDVCISALALVLLIPVLLAVALAIKLEAPRHPLFFNDMVVGRGESRFRLLKFRTIVPFQSTMLTGRCSPGYRLVTRVGRFLRRFKLDELPQFLNVLGGQMSLVGPRPIDPTGSKGQVPFSGNGS